MTSNSELRDIVKHITFMKMSEQLANGVSYDPKHQVGALIVKNDWTKIDAMGYNGAYKGSKNKRFSLESGKSKFVHAEQNAIAFSTLSQSKAKKYTMFVTLTPCEVCSRLIVNKGIKNVIVLNKYEHCGDSMEVFEDAGVTCIYIHDKIKEFFIDSKMYGEVVNIINNFLTAPNININRLDNYLLECFEKHLDNFFEFNKSFLNKLPESIVDANDNKSYDKEYVLNLYVDLFAKTLYELA